MLRSANDRSIGRAARKRFATVNDIAPNIEWSVIGANDTGAPLSISRILSQDTPEVPGPLGTGFYNF